MSESSEPSDAVPQVGASMEKLKSDFIALAASVEQRIKVLEEKEKCWEQIQQLMESHSASATNKIVLDVGGQRFASSKTTLLSHKGTFFEAMLSSGNWKPDADGAYFIDRNPELFPVILDYLRTGKINLKRYNYDVMEDLKIEFDFYLLEMPEIEQSNSKLLKVDQWKQVLSWLAGKNMTTLLYSGTRDGFSSAAFHNNCDHRGATLTIIRSSAGYLFGGYSDASWDSSSTYKVSNVAFLFTITNAHGIRPTTYPQAGSGNHIYCDVAYGPTFGGGHDIFICNNANNTSGSYSNFPNAYHDTTGRGGATFAGAKEFMINEVEVFLVQ